jgi:hypothetical protein
MSHKTRFRPKRAEVRLGETASSICSGEIVPVFFNEWVSHPSVRNRKKRECGASVLVVLLFSLVVALPAVAGVVRVWVNQDALRIGYELSEQSRRANLLERLEHKLAVELAAEYSPQRLKELANKLGMEAPAPQRVISASSEVD